MILALFLLAFTVNSEVNHLTTEGYLIVVPVGDPAETLNVRTHGIASVTLGDTVVVRPEGDTMNVRARVIGTVPVSIADTVNTRARVTNTVTITTAETIYVREVDTVTVVLGDTLPVKYANGKIRTSSQPYTYDIAEGNVTDHAAFFIYGVNLAVGTVEEAVIPTSTTQNYVAVAQWLTVHSDSARDSLNGAGANSVIIYGLDSLYVEQAETLDLNGTTDVPTTKRFLRAFRMILLTSGTAQTNLGHVYLEDSASAVVLLRMSAGRGRAHHAIWTVPAGKTAYITGFFGSEASTKGSRIDVYFRRYADGWVNPIGTALLNAFASLNLEIPYAIAEKTDVEMRATGVLTGASVTAGMEGWYE